MDSVRLPNRPPFSMTSLSIFPMASSMTCICSGVALFEFRAVAEADYLPLHLLQLLFRHLVQIAEDDIPVDGVLQFVEIKFGQRLVTLSGQHPLSFPFRLSFEDLRVYSRMMARRFCWYVPYSLL